MGSLVTIKARCTRWRWSWTGRRDTSHPTHPGTDAQRFRLQAQAPDRDQDRHRWLPALPL